MWCSENWKDYELIDSSDGERLERWGKYILIRPDPQVIWHSNKANKLWRNADGVYRRSEKGGGGWIVNKLPGTWNISYGKYTFMLKPMGFKHTGLFPEQAANWDWMDSLISNAGRPIKVLNLFAYTGGATVAAAAAGASVCHVDASKGMVAQAKENARLSGLADAPIRYIVDDCKKFVEREIRRGNKYDAVIMDPPSYGRGPTGEVWKLEESIDQLLDLTVSVLSEKPLFFLINSYTTGLSPLSMNYLLKLKLDRAGYKGKYDAGEIALKNTEGGGYLPAGASVRWSAE